MDTIQELYESHKDHFSRSDHKIMDFLLRNKAELYFITNEELVTRLNISSSTISRFWGKIGFENIKDFKNYLRSKEMSTPSTRISSELEKWNHQDYNLTVFAEQYQMHIMKTLSVLLPEQLTAACEKVKAAHHIYLFAPDASAGVAQILKFRLQRFGIEPYLMESGSQLFESMMNLSRKDLVIMFSYSRILSEVQVLLRQCKKTGCHSILFTDLLSHSDLALADTLLYSYRGEPDEYHSMTAPLMLIDLLIIKIAQSLPEPVGHVQKLEMLREQYASFIKR